MDRSKDDLRLDEELAFLSKQEKRETSETPKYLQLSPSLIELPNLDHPDQISIYDHTIAMQASVRGVLGHTLDNKITELARENLSAGEIEDRSRKWLREWKDQHVFVKQEGRKESNRYLEGEKVKAKSVEKYWKSEWLSNFEEDVIQANLSEIKDQNAIFPQGIQRDPRVLVYSESSFTNPSKFRDRRVMFTARRDYLIFDTEREQVIILDSKFGLPNEENRQSLELQALLYSLFAKKNLESLLDPSSQGKEKHHYDANRQNLDNILFYYRYLDRQKRKFIYELYDPKRLDNPYTWGRFYEFLEHYRDNYRSLRELKKRRDKAFVLPYIPEKHNLHEEDRVQKNMFGVIYESTS